MAAISSSPPAPGRGHVPALVASTFLMGSSFVAGKILLNHGLPALNLVGWRFVLAAVGCVPLALGNGTGPWRVRLVPPGLGARGWATVVAIGLLQTGATMGMLFLALRTAPAATVSVLVFTNPLWVALAGRWLLGEHLHAGRLAGLALGIAGVALALGAAAPTGGEGIVAGELWALGASLSWAAATVLQKRAALRMPPWTLSGWQMGIGALALLALGPLVGEPPAPWGRLSAADWAWFLWLALPGSTASFGLWFLALRRGGATRTSSFLFLGPLFATVLAWAVLGATLRPMQAVGGVLVGLAIYLVNRPVGESSPVSPRAVSPRSPF